MAGPSIADVLRDAPLFSQLDDGARQSCARDFAEQRHGAGTMIFARGDAGDQLFVVAEGRVRLSVMNEDGRELSVRHAVPGALLGEIAVMDGGPRSADAVALTAVRLLGIPRARLQAHAAAFPALAQGMIALLCQRLRDTTEQLEGIALHPIEVRLARFLLIALDGREAPAGKRVPLEMGYSQSELAQLLGASRPKVNVALGELEKSGAVKRTADRLFCDPSLLRDMAGVAGG
ncbi:MAG: Crp/Fnr family transcriptional regulator [Beijerinckiaceae bacterium]